MRQTMFQFGLATLIILACLSGLLMPFAAYALEQFERPATRPAALCLMFIIGWSLYVAWYACEWWLNRPANDGWD